LSPLFATYLGDFEMATYTDSLGFNKGQAAPRVEGLNKVTRYEVELDFAAIAAARLAAGATALAAADVLQVLPIPAKSLVMHVGVDVSTAGTSGLTLDVGDGTDPDGYLDGVSGAAVGSFASVTTEAADAIVGLSAGKYYSAADTVDVVLVGQAPGALKCRVWALVADAS
jgi:peptidoglycan hydrolase-like protein with peptidoglycan-binding domain